MNVSCECIQHPKRVHRLHDDVQDESLDVWKRLLDYIADVAAAKVEFSAPGQVLRDHGWENVVTLPAEIRDLKEVRDVCLYSSNLVRIPPEIGEMSSLESFDVYTSYRLHWLPYELTRCQNLVESKASARALYGNYKNRFRFPSLRRRSGNDDVLHVACPPLCSVCGQNPVDVTCARWVSVRVATDVLPLLMFACSERCRQAAEPSPPDYVQGLHLGGQIKQPPAQW